MKQKKFSTSILKHFSILSRGDSACYIAMNSLGRYCACVLKISQSISQLPLGLPEEMNLPIRDLIRAPYLNPCLFSSTSNQLVLDLFKSVGHLFCILSMVNTSQGKACQNI